jgi:hypothetical protein
MKNVCFSENRCFLPVLDLSDIMVLNLENKHEMMAQGLNVRICDIILAQGLFVARCDI